MTVLNKLQCAYLAGLIDGEGYIGILKVKRGNKKIFHSTKEYFYQPVFKLAMTDREIIEYYYKSLGGNFEIRKLSEKKTNWKDCYTWTVRSAKCIEILKLIYPYMRVKKQEVDILNKFNKTNNGAGIPLTDNQWEVRDNLYQQLRDLHFRGTAA